MSSYSGIIDIDVFRGVRILFPRFFKLLCKKLLFVVIKDRWLISDISCPVCLFIYPRQKYKRYTLLIVNENMTLKPLDYLEVLVLFSNVSIQEKSRTYTGFQGLQNMGKFSNLKSLNRHGSNLKIISFGFLKLFSWKSFCYIIKSLL